MSANRSAAAEYHSLTKYSPESIRSSPPLDWSKQPEHFKDIVSNRRTALRGYLPTRGPSTVPCPVGSLDRDPGGLGLGQLSRLLFFTNGVTAAIHFQDGRSHFLRAAPSAGALYPTEIYVATRGIAGLDDGLYNYQAGEHELVLLWEGNRLDELGQACGDHAAALFENAHAALICTGLLWRSAWRYQERGYRRVLLDTGHVLANLCAYAPHESCRALPLLGFCDTEVNGLFFFEETVEVALACVPLLPSSSRAEPPPLWASPRSPARELAVKRMTRSDDLRESATVALHRASSCGNACEPTAIDSSLSTTSGRAIPLADAPGVVRSIPRTILKRRSARGYTGEPIPLDAVGACLGFALGRGGDLDPWNATRASGLLDLHLIAVDVNGLDAGIYRVEGRGDGLLPLTMGVDRDAVLHLSLGQDIARQCAAMLVFSAPAGRSLELFGDRAYRYLHLEAGAIGERFQLAAVKQGHGACGIGGFFDDEVNRLLQLPDEHMVLYLVTIGDSVAT